MTPQIKQLAETYDYIYQGVAQQVTVTVHINYEDGHISLGELEKGYKGHPSTFKKKTYQFNERELEYMQGWQDVLSGMKCAITDATEKLKSYQEAENEKNLVEAFIEDVKEK